MIIRKLLWVPVLLLTAGLLFPGCAGDKDGGSDSSPSDNSSSEIIIDESEVITCRYDSTTSEDNCIDYLMADGWDTDSVTAHCTPMANSTPQVLSITTGNSCLTEIGQTGDYIRCFAPEVCGTFGVDYTPCPDALNYYGYLPNGFESICSTFMLGELQTAPFGEHYVGEPDPCDGIVCESNSTCSEGSCECDAGWTGDDCETDIDDCASNPCQNGGACTDGVDSYTCDCSGTGYVGDDCETNINDCASNPCQNEGTCTDGINSYTCDCSGTGYEGDDCETNIDDCTPNPCNDGACTDGVNSYTCDCSGTGYEGDDCETEINECASGPCQHDGICSDLVNDYSCNCSGTGWEGNDCENDIDECESNPCENSETSGICANTDGSYSCDCSGTGGWSGDNCQIPPDDPCVVPVVVDCNAGTCVVGEGTCDCTGTGYEGTNCESDIDECTPSNPCQNGGTCNNTDGSYYCDCADGWGGTNCESWDPCASELNACHQNEGQGTCADNAGEAECTCNIGWLIGDGSCNDEDWCASDPCNSNGTCNEAAETCTCDLPYVGPDCTARIDDDVITCRYDSSQSTGNCIDYPTVEGWDIDLATAHCTANATGTPPNMVLVDGPVDGGDSCLVQNADAGGAIDRCYAPELCGSYPNAYLCNDVSDDHNALYYYGYLLDGYQGICSVFMQGQYQDGPFAQEPYELP